MIATKSTPLTDEEEFPVHCGICILPCHGVDRVQRRHAVCEQRAADAAQQDRDAIYGRAGITVQPATVTEHIGVYRRLHEYHRTLLGRETPVDGRIYASAVMKVIRHHRETSERLHVEQVATEAADVTTWRWVQPGRGKPGVGREIVVVRRNPHGYRAGPDHDCAPEVCRNIFRPGQHRCPPPIEYRVERTSSRMIHTHYACAEHLDDRYRQIVGDGTLRVDCP